MDSVPTSRFYGSAGNRFVPPLLRGNSRVRSVVLHTKEVDDPSRSKFRIFPTQAEAFEEADSGIGQSVWAFEIDKTGRRRFLVASPSQLWRWYRRVLRRPEAPLHMYEVIRRGAACKLYFDLEFRRDNEKTCSLDGLPLVAEVVEGVSALVNEWSAREGAEAIQDVVELRSSTEQKFSTHLIFPSVCFRNNAECGVFAVEVESRLSPLSREIGFVDCSVYTPNRCFRLVGSSKFGRVQRLLHPTSLASENNSRPKCSEKLFYSSLVGHVGDSVALISSETLVARCSPSGFQRDVVGGAKSVPNLPTSRCAKSPFPAIDEYVRNLVRPRNGQIYTATYFSGSSSVSYAIKGGWRYCHRIARHHRSNNVIIVVSLQERTAHQRCFDRDCRDYRSPPWPVPPEVIPNPTPRLESPKFDELLDAYMSEWEPTAILPERNFSGGVTDEELLSMAVDPNTVFPDNNYSGGVTDEELLSVAL